MVFVQPDDIAAVVSGTVINDEQFNVIHCLIKNRLDPVLQKGTMIEIRYDDTDLRHKLSVKSFFDPFEWEKQEMSKPVSQCIPESAFLFFQSCL